MSSNNGNGQQGGGGGAIPFKREVPIVGQPFAMKSWFLTIAIVCNCEAKEPVLLVGNGVGRCTSCRRTFQSQGLKAGPNGDVQFMIALVAQAEEPVVAGGN
jgi:hypothetical protein